MLTAVAILAIIFLIATVILGYKYEDKCSENAELKYKLTTREALIKSMERRNQESINRMSIVQHALKKSRKQKDIALRKIKSITTEQEFFDFMNEVEK